MSKGEFNGHTHMQNKSIGSSQQTRSWQTIARSDLAGRKQSKLATLVGAVANPMSCMRQVGLRASACNLTWA